jgi:hypothetical protein
MKDAPSSNFSWVTSYPDRFSVFIILFQYLKTGHSHLFSNPNLLTINDHLPTSTNLYRESSFYAIDAFLKTVMYTEIK